MAVVILAIGAWFLGGVALRHLDVRGAEGVGYRLLTGLCLCAVLFAAFGSFSLRAAQWVMYGLSALGLVYGAWMLHRRKGRVARPKALRDPFTKLELAALATLALANGLTLLHALAPNTSWDAGVAHLALPAAYTRDGVMGLLPGNVYSAYPHLLHSLYTFAFSVSGEWAAAMVNWFFGPLGCIALYALGKRVEGRACGLIAAALYATAPVFVNQAGAVSVDVPFAAMAAMSLACFVAWRDEKSLRWLALSAFAAGSACGMRHTGYVVCVLLTLGVLTLGRERRFLSTAVFACTGLAAAAPWLLRSAWVVGNPVYPFFQSILARGALPVTQFTAVGAHSTVQSLAALDLLRFPWDVIMHPERFDGWSASPGGLVLFLAVPGIVVGGRHVRALAVYTLAGVVIFFYFQRLARYLLPFMTPMMVVAGVAALRLEKLRVPIAALLIFTFGYGLTLAAGAVHFKAPVVFGLTSREAYRTDRIERYPAFNWVNENLPKTATVLTLDPRSYFIDAPTYQDFEILTGLPAMSTEAQLAWFREKEIRYLFLPNTYVEESPGFANIGLLDLFESWRKMPGQFRLVKAIEMARARQDGTERVEIYEILYDSVAASAGAANEEGTK